MTNSIKIVMKKVESIVIIINIFKNLKIKTFHYKKTNQGMYC